MIIYTVLFIFLVGCSSNSENVNTKLSEPTKNITSETISTATSDNKESQEQENTDEWIQLSERAFKVQGTIEEVKFESDHLKMIKLKCTKNLKVPTNPVEYDYVGKTLEIFYNKEHSLDTDIEKTEIVKTNIKKGEEVIMTFTNYEINSKDSSETKKIMGALNTLYLKDGVFHNLAGEVVSID